MSTDGTNPTEPTPGATAATPDTEQQQPYGAEPHQPPATSEGTLANVEPTEHDPGFITRHTTTLITLMVAVIVAAVAIAGVMLYRNHIDSENTKNETAVAQTVAAQGATVETVECNGGSCTAIINGQAYSVLVQKDAKGKRHVGVSAYGGN